MPYPSAEVGTPEWNAQYAMWNSYQAMDDTGRSDGHDIGDVSGVIILLGCFVYAMALMAYMRTVR